jgi:hypothetical protein
MKNALKSILIVCGRLILKGLWRRSGSEILLKHKISGLFRHERPKQKFKTASKTKTVYS